MAYPKIEGERLDHVLQRLREKGDSSAIPATDEFEALLSRAPDQATADGALQTLLIDFIMPTIKDPGILQENRTIMLLEHLRDQVLPKLNESSETMQMATRVIDDEIGRYADLRERRQAGIAA